MNHRLFRSGLLAVALSTLAPLAAWSAGGAASLREGVVVDGAKGLAYVMHPQGGVEALDLRNGASLWRSNEAERPLAVSGGALVAQARPGKQGELRIVALDLERKGARSAEADLKMPEGVKAETAETLQRFFHVRAADSAQGLVVSWMSEPRPSLATRTLDHIGSASPNEVAGAKRASWGGWQGSALFDPHAGSLLAIDSDQALQLSGPRKAVAVPLAGANPEARSFASIDGRHVLVSRPAPAGADYRYTWTLSEADSGRTLGTIESRLSMSPFLVVGNQVIHVAMPRMRGMGKDRVDTPLRLRAVDLTSGREAWSHELRDPEFRGPTPD